MTVRFEVRRGGMRIVGSGGGGKGGGSSRTPVETPDSLHNSAYAAVLDVIGNGEMYGPVHRDQPLRDVFLDGTPIQNEDGSLNFSQVQADYRVGTVDQEHIAGFPASANTIGVNVEVKTDRPWVQAITNPELSAVRVTMYVPRLVQALESGKNAGDRVGYRVEYAIDLAVGGGAFQEIVRTAFDGKTSNGYTRTHRLDLPVGASSWAVRARRITPEANNAAISDSISVQSYAEVIDGKFRHPMTAMMGIKISAEQFQAIPTRAYRWRGQIIRIPSNYDPVARTYAGVWDGTFKRGWSNNPAWIYYDILTSRLYGLGDRIDAGMIDRYALYQIGAYCDQAVPDGQGGTEPRFVCNVYLQSAADALRVLNDLTSTFRGMAYWANGQVVASADAPSDPVYTYTNANVLNARFNYPGADLSTLKTVALVSWNDPSDFYRSKVEVVEDDDGIRRYGIRKTEVVAFGCTSRGQAQRVGLYQLYTSRMESGGLTFSVGLDGVIPQPGSIVKIADRNRAGRHIGGRIRQATADTVTVDRDHPIKAGDLLTVNLATGLSETRTVKLVSDRVITVLPAFSQAPAAESVWAVDADDLVTQHARILSVKESDGIEFFVSAVLHHPGKFDAIDNGVRLDPLPVSVVPPRVQTAPANVRIEQHYTIHQGTTRHYAEISWDAAEHAVLYDVQWRRDNGDWVLVPRTGSRLVELPDIYAGTYTVRVRAINALDVPSLWAYSTATLLDGLVGSPPAVTSLVAAGETLSIRLTWAYPTTPNIVERVQIWSSETQQFDSGRVLTNLAYPDTTYTLGNQRAGVPQWFWARLVDKNGLPGPWYPDESESGVRGSANIDPGLVLELVGDRLLSSTWGQQMTERVEDIDYRMLDIRAEVGATDELIEKTRLQVRDQGRVLDSQSRDLQQHADQLVENIQAIEAEAQARETGLQQQADALAAESRDRIQKQQQQAADIAVNTAAISAEIANRVDAVDALRQETDGRFSAMQAEMSEILGTEDYQPGQAYLAGALVKYLGKLYRARQDIPAGVAPPDARWELIGDYESMGAAVADLSSRMVSVEVLTETQTLRIDSVETRTGQNTSKIDGLRETVDGQSTVLQGLRTDVDGNTSEVRSLQQTTGNMALVQNQLRTDVDGVRSDLSSVQQVQDGLVQDVSALGVKAGDLEARADALTEVAADHALDLLRLRASEGDAEGMYTHFARADARQVQRMERLQLQADGQQSQIEDIATVQVGHAERIGTVETQAASALSRVQVVETATQTQASRLETVEQQSGDNASRVAQLQSAQEGQASLLADLRTDVDGNTNTAAQLLQTTDELATQQTQLATRVGNAESGLQSVQQTAAGTAQDLTVLTVRTEAAESDITVLRQGQADQASSLVALKTQTDNNTATASQLLQTTGELSAAQTLLRNDVDGVRSDLSSVQQVQDGLVQDVSALGVKAGDLEARADALTEVAADHALELIRLRASEGDAEGMYTSLIRADARQVQRMERLDLRVDGVVSSYEEVITLAEELSGRQETLTFELNGLSGQVQTLDVAQQGLAGQISTVSARTDVAQQKANAAQAAADQANAAAVQNAADIVAERTARTTAESAQAQTNQQLTASFQQAKTAADAAQGSADQADARVAAEELARASADAALAQRSTALEAKTDTHGTQLETLDQLTQEQILRQLEMRAMTGDAEGWMIDQQRLQAATARRVEQQAVQFDGMLASIEGIKETIVDETGALAQQINTVSAAATAAGTAAAGAQADADAAQATADLAVANAAVAQSAAATADQKAAAAAGIADGKAVVLYQTTTPAATYRNDKTLWIDITGNANTPKRWNGSAWAAVTDKAATDAASAAAAARADAAAAQATANEAVASAATNAAAIQLLQTTTANQFQAQAQQIETLQASVVNASASVQETNTALATLDGRIEAWRNVKVQTNVNGVDYIAGTSLGIDGEGNSSFNVLAQSFNVMHNINGTPQAVFSVVGGQMVVRDALIGKISAEKVDAETISAISADLGDITAGTLSGATAGINLNATGGESFIDVGNGKVVIRANGDSYFDGVVISRPTIMGTGSYALNGLILGHVLGTLGRPDEQIDSRYIYIDTGIDDPYDWAYGHAKPSYTARAKLDGWNEVDAPISGGTQIVLEATACCESVLIGTGANPNQVGRVFLRIGIHLVNGRPGQTRVRLNSLTWAVFKLT
ncbi:phage tail protein [Kerstersia gyiorum]|uniref:TipJ family phage tail tip protein n=1 Tax=Kerstersia gyiorum TaxID=206506 RepID=UPI0021501F31|nr:phage tail protein [Kerstersia gyiorum]MCR4158844.1 phage tail protein [Kerstersia gyiorum]